MKRLRRQEGQALIGALVTMVLLFSMAGGLAVAVSAALQAQGSGTTSRFLRDAQAQSAASVLMAGVAGPTADCPTGGLGANQEFAPSSYACHRVDWITPSAVSLVTLNWQGSCAVAKLTGTKHTALWLNTVTPLSSMYVDGSAAGCSPGGSACQATDAPSGPAHFYMISDCVLSDFGTAYLHVGGPAGSAPLVRLASVASFLPEAHSPLGVGPAPDAITAARLRGPQSPMDLVVASQTAGSLSVLLGHGDGTFTPGQTVSVGAHDLVFGFTLARLRGAGNPLDLAVADLSRNVISVWLGNGNGTFSWSRDYPVGMGPVAVVAGNFLNGDNNDCDTQDDGDGNLNNNGRLDLAVANYLGGTVTIMQGAGDGTFMGSCTTSQQQLSSPPTALAAIGSGGRSRLAVGLGSGNLTLFDVRKNGKLKVRQSWFMGAAPTAMALGDFNGNLGDLAVAVQGTGRVWFFSGANNDLSLAGSLAAGAAPWALTAGHFGGSGHADLAVTNSGSNTVTVLLNDGNGGFGAIPAGSPDGGPMPFAVAAGDLDGSGQDGLAVGNFSAGKVTVLLRNRSRLFSVVGSAAPSTSHDEADLVSTRFAGTNSNTLSYEGGLG